MARNFLQYPFSQYQGRFSSKATKIANGHVRTTVAANVQWAIYNVGGQPLGVNNPNFTVNVNLNAQGPGTLPSGWVPISVYIDNEAVNFPVYVFFPSTGHAVSCPPNSSGWYQVFTLDGLALITGLGIPSADIANAVVTNCFFTDVPMVPYLDQEQQTAVTYGLASPLINLGTSGGQMVGSGPTVITQGSGYVSGSLSVNGGGGISAAAVGNLDGFGRFTSATWTNKGSGYTGTPVIAPTGAQGLYGNWQSGVNYSVGQLIVGFGGGAGGANAYWQCQLPNNTNEAPNGGNGFWANTGIVANAVAALQGNGVTPIVGGSAIAATSAFGARALGDQVQTLSDTLTGTGVFRNNLWGTPYGSGFIYLTNVEIYAGASNADAWQIDDPAGDVLMKLSGLGLGVPIVSFDGCNIKIPATTTWRLNCTNFAAGMGVQHNWCWTYANQ